jgi:hypothetical protein
MRGRKTDSVFISDFITDCVKAGHDTAEAIVQRAKQSITSIDDEILQVEKLKVTRAKLLDVIATFEKASKPSRTEEVRILSFFKIQHPQICKFICDSMKSGVVAIENLSSKYPTPEIVFCVKQLLEHKIIARSGSHLLRGEAFDDYLKFILRES